MWRKTFQKELGFTGWVQRWSFNIASINWLAGRESEKRVTVEAWKEDTGHPLIHKVQFSHGGSHELLTEKSHKEVAHVFVALTEGKRAKVLVHGVDAEGYFLDDCVVMIVENE